MDDTTRGVEGRDTSGARGTAGVSDPETDRRTEEIQQEIRETRAELSETIEAIQDRLRPSNIVADATDRVKTATTEKVKNMAETASDTAQGVMRETRERAYDIVEGARQNPIPALMIGAGVAWLLMDRKRGDNGYTRKNRQWSDYSSQGRSSAYGESGDYYQSSTNALGVDSDYQAGAGRSYGYSGSQSASSRDMGREARETARRVQNGFQRLLQDNPLLVGAAAVLVGAAVGAAVPETERENQLMGEARDTVVDRAQEMARNAASSVQDVAGNAIGEVAERAVKGNQ